MERFAYSLKESAASLSVEVRIIRKAIAAKQLRATRIGRRVVISADNLRKFAAQAKPNGTLMFWNLFLIFILYSRPSPLKRKLDLNVKLKAAGKPEIP
jgi:excisionase family DNA binding protein